MSENNAPYIKNVKLKGYKSIKDLEIDLLPGLNIIIGPNGSGKSNFLELVEKTLDFDYDVKQVSKIDAELTLITENFHLLLPKGEFFIHLKNSKKEFFSKVNHKLEPVEMLFMQFIKSFFFKINFLLPEKIKSLEDNCNLSILLMQNDDVSGFFIVEKPTGNNLHFLFRHLEDIVFSNSDKIEKILESGKDDDNFLKNEFENDKKIIEIQNNLKLYTPINAIRISDGFSIKSNKVDEININYLRLEFLINEEWLDWQQLSDGTKRLFYIVAEITAHEDKIILLEEPEIGVHPTQLFSLMNFLISQAKHKQIIISTHSPQVLNTLASYQLQSIIVAEMTDKGTKMRHLTEKQIKKAKKYMATELSLGDYWLHSDLEPQNTAL